MNQKFTTSQLMRFFVIFLTTTLAVNLTWGQQQKLREVSIVLESGHTYNGTINENGQPEGYGKLERTTGSVYVGHFRNGKRDGYGKEINADDNINEGLWVKGSIYEGQWVNDKREGHGIYRSSLLMYIGNFKADRMEDDSASIDFCNGHSYQGAIHNNLPNGHGTYKTFEGTFVGEFKNGDIEGEGVYTNRSLDYPFREVRGIWHNNRTIYNGHEFYLATIMHVENPTFCLFTKKHARTLVHKGCNVADFNFYLKEHQMPALKIRYPFGGTESRSTFESNRLYPFDGRLSYRISFWDDIACKETPYNVIEWSGNKFFSGMWGKFKTVALPDGAHVELSGNTLTFTVPQLCDVDLDLPMAFLYTFRDRFRSSPLEHHFIYFKVEFSTDYGNRWVELSDEDNHLYFEFCRFDQQTEETNAPFFSPFHSRD